MFDLILGNKHKNGSPIDLANKLTMNVMQSADEKILRKILNGFPLESGNTDLYAELAAMLQKFEHDNDQRESVREFLIKKGMSWVGAYIVSYSAEVALMLNIKIDMKQIPSKPRANPSRKSETSEPDQFQTGVDTLRGLWHAGKTLLNTTAETSM